MLPDDLKMREKVGGGGGGWKSRVKFACTHTHT